MNKEFSTQSKMEGLENVVKRVRAIEGYTWCGKHMEVSLLGIYNSLL